MSKLKVVAVLTLIAGGSALGSVSASASVPAERSFCEHDTCQLLVYCDGTPNSNTGCDKVAPDTSSSPLCSTYECDDNPIDPEG